MQTSFTPGRRAAVVILAAAICGGALVDLSAAEGVRPLVPRPETGRDPRLVAILANLLRIARDRDAHGLRRYLAADVVTDEPIASGIDAFERRWATRDARSSFWASFQRALELGGDLERGAASRFIVPYVMAKWPPELAPARHVAIVVPRASLRASPSSEAPSRAIVGFEILRFAGAHEHAPSGWLKVRTPRGLYGFISSGEVWAPTRPRIVLSPRRGEPAWAIVEVLTGWSAARPPPFTIPRPYALER